VEVAKAGYRTDTITVNLQPGQVAARTIALLPFDFSVDEAAGDHRVKIYPNPSEAVFSIEVANAGNSELRLEAYDMTGRRIEEFMIPMAGGKAEVRHLLSPGMYVFRVYNSGGLIDSFNLAVH
jgi:hypothetical protein